jgi:hypothetical protein
MRAMPGVGFAERYVIARESNVVRVDFARRPERWRRAFPALAGYGPRSRCNGSVRAASSVCFRLRESGMGCALLCCQPLPQFVPASGKGVAPAFELLERGWA